MFRSVGSRVGPHLRRLTSQPAGELTRWQSPGKRYFCNRGRDPRHLPISLWVSGGRGPWGGMRGFDDLASRLMDRHRQMERMMDEVISASPVWGRMWPRWAEWGPAGAGRGSGRGEVQSVKYDSKEYEIKLDVSSFKAEELEVKLTSDRLSVTGKHEQKQDDHGYVSRQFSRHFEVPEDVDAESMETMLNNEGALIIRAKVKGAENQEGRTLNIEKEAPAEEKKD